MVEKKMTEEKISQARDLFKKNPLLCCRDVADTLGISESLLRKYLRKECHEANKRRIPLESQR